MSLAGTAPWESLRTIVGPGQITTDSEQLQGYRVSGKTPKAVVRPGSEQEVAEIVRFLAMERLTLVPIGARTKRAMHVPTAAFDVTVDMARLDRVVAYDPDDLTLSVEAGVPLSRLATVLAEHRQFLPLAVPFMNCSTVGGTIASGVDSPLRQFYGTARDYVLGMEFVTGDGRVVKSGGRVVKNVSGYDLHKLMIGSFGSLGVITKVNFRTFPMAASTGAFVAFFDSGQGAVGICHQIAQSPLRPLTLEILSPQAAELVLGDRAAGVESGSRLIDTPSAHWALLVSFAGSGGMVERYERDLRALAGRGVSVLLDENTTSAVLARIREFSPMALESSPRAVILRLSVLPSEIAQALDELALVADKQDLPWAAMARGVGVIYFALLPTAHDGGVRVRLGRALDDLFDAFRPRERSIAMAWCAEEFKEAMSPRKTTRNDLEQMRKIKHAFDPTGVFAPDPLGAWV
ncbi:MAG TPA: FAD-binding oxidoreductase [Candidatus Acidoferrum sp.]|nr:FAD-binding oxidoreductase [Candidatus Acidoferrum sp.]